MNSEWLQNEGKIKLKLHPVKLHLPKPTIIKMNREYSLLLYASH